MIYYVIQVIFLFKKSLVFILLNITLNVSQYVIISARCAYLTLGGNTRTNDITTLEQTFYSTCFLNLIFFYLIIPRLNFFHVKLNKSLNLNNQLLCRSEKIHESSLLDIEPTKNKTLLLIRIKLILISTLSLIYQSIYYCFKKLVQKLPVK